MPLIQYVAANFYLKYCKSLIHILLFINKSLPKCEYDLNNQGWRNNFFNHFFYLLAINHVTRT